MSDDPLFYCDRCDTVRSENLTRVGPDGVRYDEICAYDVHPYEPEVPRCETCKHWDPRPDDGEPATEGFCRRVDDRYWDPEAGSGGAIVLFAGMPGRGVPMLLTLADFGCTEHTPRPLREDPR